MALRRGKRNPRRSRWRGRRRAGCDRGNEAGEDGAYLYFVANGVLAPNATSGDCSHAEAGQELGDTCNLYRRHDGATTFIATLSGKDDLVGLGGAAGFDIGDWQPGLGFRTAEVTPDGDNLVFESYRSLTGYNSNGLSEVFVYDTDLGHVFCASCNPSGEPPSNTETHAAAYLPESTTTTYLPRWISGDGSRVFFDSVEPLVPQASNGRQDVYEWERDGTGICQDSEGCIYLISGATSSDNSYLLDASASGNDVFFVTRAKLVPQDTNNNFNLFDARVGGVQPLATQVCSGTGCQGVPPERPILQTPASATFSGVGNFASPPAPSSSTKAATKSRPLTRAQKLAKTLKACDGKRNKRSEMPAKRGQRNAMA